MARRVQPGFGRYLTLMGDRSPGAVNLRHSDTYGAFPADNRNPRVHTPHWQCRTTCFRCTAARARIP